MNYYDYYDYYKSINIHTKINYKGEIFKLALGISFKNLSNLFSFKEKLEILHNKLILKKII